MIQQSRYVNKIVPPPPDFKSFIELLAEKDDDEREEILKDLRAELGDERFANLRYEWKLWGRPNQFAPEPRSDWRTWCILAGRGWGKTRVGAETVYDAVKSGRAKRIALIAPTAADISHVMLNGEALALDTPIPTLNGWVRMGDLKPGDMVFNELGDARPIEWISSIMVNRPCYEVVFSDGESIIADANHKWFTYTRAAKLAAKRSKNPIDVPAVATTQEILDSLLMHGWTNHSIPCSGALDYSEKDLLISPYVFGAWLGDGAKREGQFTSNDEEILQSITNSGYEIRKVSGSFAYSIIGIKSKLRELGVLGRKHIPEIYRLSSRQQRLHIVQGLMDTDGSISKSGQCDFSNTNLEIVDGLREILLSLGIKVGQVGLRLPTDKQKLKFIDPKPLYRITFTTKIPVFRLRRKLERIKDTLSPKYNHRFIVEVNPVESVPVRCISIDSPNHIFLAGRACIPTHNSGLLNICPPWDKPEWSPTNRIVRWKNGAIAETYSAEEPERLRGPQHDFAWCDEIAAWRYPETWDMLQFGLRLGRNPQVVVTTTPKPVPVLKEILKLPGTWTTLGTTYENVSNLSTSFFTDIIKKYEGTRLGEQELMAHIIEDVPGALWNRDNLDKYRIKLDKIDDLPDFLQVVVAIDPATTARSSSAMTGLCVAAYGADDNYYILHLDAVKESPNEWAERVLDLYDQYRADRIVAEVNNGGDLVNAVITNVRPFVKVDAVYASRGKVTRAEPVSTMYERGRVHHVGFFPSGEEQMVQFNPSENPYGLKDMVDALVWAMTKLIEDTQGVDYYKPKVGGIRQKLVSYKYR